MAYFDPQERPVRKNEEARAYSATHQQNSEILTFEREEKAGGRRRTSGVFRSPKASFPQQQALRLLRTSMGAEPCKHCGSTGQAMSAEKTSIVHVTKRIIPAFQSGFPAYL
ncbi:hypothetical protein [uncultured Bacteroides sp.]|uniref:hypothetical protein n=1 Tax=uncultured Bacteroides sp. TaxID=162156 RepID=UPI00260F8044|nr:hypothetical protein [uncultured Bacteroides sp.]